MIENMSCVTDVDISMVTPHVREVLDRNRASREIVGVMLDYETLVQEDSIIVRCRGRCPKDQIKKTLNILVDEGLLDTGYEAGTRWYYFRKECKSHFTGEIEPNREYRGQLRRFIGIYED
jgi:hypothetical protein